MIIVKLRLLLLIRFVQYLPHVIRKGERYCHYFTVIFAVVIVWIYAHLLTVGGAYNGAAPKTQNTCRTDRAGLIAGAPWSGWVVSLKNLLLSTFLL